MTGLRQREPRERCEAYLAHVRTLPCLICSRPSEAAHIRMACDEVGKDHTGGGRKSSDKWALPLCHDHHMEQHDAGSEIVFWKFYGLDPFAIAMRLWNAWKKQPGYTGPKPTNAGSRSSKERTRKPRPDTAKAASKPVVKLRGKSAWPKRHGTMKSRNSFGGRGAT